MTMYQQFQDIENELTDLEGLLAAMRIVDMNFRFASDEDLNNHPALMEARSALSVLSNELKAKMKSSFVALQAARDASHALFTGAAMKRRDFMFAAPVVACVPAAAPAHIPESLGDRVMHHVAEINRLLTEAAPEGVTLKGVCWRTEQPDSFWASGAWVHPDDPMLYRLAHFRPQYRRDWWIQSDSITPSNTKRI